MQVLSKFFNYSSFDEEKKLFCGTKLYILRQSFACAHKKFVKMLVMLMQGQIQIQPILSQSGKKGLCKYNKSKLTSLTQCIKSCIKCVLFYLCRGALGVAGLVFFLVPGVFSTLCKEILSFSELCTRIIIILIENYTP